MQKLLWIFIGDKGAEEFGFHIVLGLDLARKDLTLVLGKEFYFKRGVVLAIVIGWYTSNTNKFLQEIVLGIGSLELCKGIVAKQHILGTRFGQQGEKATIEQIDFECIAVFIELERIFGR